MTNSNAGENQVASVNQPILDAIANAQEAYKLGLSPSVILDSDEVEPMDEDDKAAILAFMHEKD
jgi:hypothetical protein